MSLFFNNYPFHENNRSILDNSDFDEDGMRDLYDHPFFNINKYRNCRSGFQNNKKNTPTGTQNNKSNTVKKSSTKLFDKDVYKLVDFSPKVNIGEDTNNYYIEVDLPGMTKEQIHVELTEENTIIISGERVKKNNNKKDMKVTKIDCPYGKFQRSFSVPEQANIEKIEAKIENGALNVTIPKKVTTKIERRTLQIQ